MSEGGNLCLSGGNRRRHATVLRVDAETDYYTTPRDFWVCSFLKAVRQAYGVERYELASLRVTAKVSFPFNHPAEERIEPRNPDKRGTRVFDATSQRARVIAATDGDSRAIFY